nr:MAG TPA: hypothetical protein [Bacteriophage sp.]
MLIRSFKSSLPFPSFSSYVIADGLTPTTMDKSVCDHPRFSIRSFTSSIHSRCCWLMFILLFLIELKS